MNEQNKYDKAYLRSDVLNLQRRSQQHLNSIEYAVVENLLKEYETLFSASDSDLGKTIVVKHKINTAGLKLKAKKCELFSKQVIFLGHVISPAEIATDPEKTGTIETLPVPKHVKEMRSFLGFCGYDRKFIQNVSGISKPLHRLTEKGRTNEWNEQCQEALECLKSRLVSSPVLELLAKIRDGYYWPGLQTDVKQYIIGCTQCSKRKAPSPKKRAPMQILESSFPMERIEMDILCELLLARSGNKHILVISD
ncbi:unnamed protein product [Mytilus coruscus]|uniref:Integrase zinc-binding domain-containing protein n=1 Tax=Mytilus coruscus TaxID=42192 RepID=A0A6J8DD49_MYTCO|nr:unnamed protein product [Mytilus coruscus]